MSNSFIIKNLKIITIILATLLATFTITSESYSFWPTKNKEKKEESKQHLIPLEIKDDGSKSKKGDGTIYARLKPTDKGKEAGLDKMLLEGKVIDTKEEGRKKLQSIIWSKATYGKETVDIDTPLQSRVATKNGVKKGDKFSAKGNSRDLLTAWNKLQDQKGDKSSSSSSGSSSKEEDKLNQSNVSSSGQNDTGYLSTGQSSNSSLTDQNTLPSATPNYTPESTITTSEGCKIRVDIDGGVAVVQEQQLQGGKVVKACYDSTTSYPLEKSYDKCQDYIDYSSMKVYKQYTLSYNLADAGGSITVQNCQIDSEKFAEIITDYSKCSLSHNFKEGYSTQQKRLLYLTNNGAAEFVLQDCHDDTSKKYLHYETSDTCKDVVANNEVVIYTRKYVKVDNKTQYISDCAPQANKVTIHSETCKTNPYTHDFVSGQSYLNKTYFYYKNNQRVDLETCSKSEEVFTHKQETESCPIKNIDELRVTELSVKTYIEVEGSKVYIKDCEALASKPPYTQIKTKWVKENTSVSKHSMTTNNIAPKTHIGWTFHGSPIAQATQDWCYNHDIPDFWVITDGRNIDEANSDEFLQYEYKIYNAGCYNGGHSTMTYRGVTTSGTCAWYIECWNPYCSVVTALNKYPIYTRYDGTEFLDKSQILETKYVCGYGHIVDGKEE